MLEDLHEKLNWERIGNKELVFVDVETTGLDKKQLRSLKLEL